jgi:hypothetical protein
MTYVHLTHACVAQAEARLSRGLADLKAAEVGLAISRALYDTSRPGGAPMTWACWRTSA